MNHRNLALVLVALLAVSAMAAIYKWVDERGVMQYGESPPADGAAQELSLPPGPPQERLDKAQEQWRSELEKKRRSEAPQAVHGTATITFVPSELAVLPRRLRKVTLLIRSLKGGKEIRQTINDPDPDWVLEAPQGNRTARSHHNFQLQLPPGSYRIYGVEFEAEGIWSNPISFFGEAIDFEVPEGSCIYVGRVGWVALILPPASLSQAKDMMQDLMKRSGVSRTIFTYHQKGSLVPTGATVDQPSAEDNRHDMIARKNAEASQCVTSIARHAK